LSWQNCILVRQETAGLHEKNPTETW